MAPESTIDAAMKTSKKKKDRASLDVGTKADFSTETAEKARPSDFINSKKRRKSDVEGLFVIDRAQPEGTMSEVKKGPAWVDEDDGFSVELRSASRLKKLRKKSKEKKIAAAELESRLRERFGETEVSWAKKRADDDGKVRRLAASSQSLVNDDVRLDVLRLADANVREPAKAVVRALDFGEQELLLTGGFDKTLRLFKVDGQTNARVAVVHAADCPIYTAKFVDARTCVLSGRRPFFYRVDLETTVAARFPIALAHRDVRSLERFANCGHSLAFTANDGRVLLCDAKSGVWKGALKLDGDARALAFIDEHTLLCATRRAEIYQWDLRSTRQCVARQSDLGASPTSSLAADKDTFTAVGTESGVLNLYSAGLHFDKALLNLTTSVDSIAVQPHLLAYASSWTKDALRVVRRDNSTVYANWPTSSSPLHYVHSLAFSKPTHLATHSYLAIGNDRGRVLLYKVKHAPVVL